MMLSARFDQCAAFFALPENTPDQVGTEDYDQVAGSPSPTRPAKALDQSTLSTAKWQIGRKQHNGTTSPKRGRRFSIFEEVEQQQDFYEKKVRFDLTQNEVHEFKRRAAPSPRAQQTRVGAAWEAHQPGVNDFMSGSIVSSTTASHRCASRSHALRITDDQTVAWFDLDAALKAMPFKVVSKVDLTALNIFEDHFPDDVIRDDFQITYLGIQRSIEDAEEAMRCENAEGWSYDEILVGELARRAGIFAGYEKVEYVEDMIPIIGEADEKFDVEYWAMVWNRGVIWDELSVATTEAIAKGNSIAVDHEMS